MVPNIGQINQRLHHTSQKFQNKESRVIPKENQTQFQEITRELLDRQNDYDKLNKIYTSTNSNHKGNSQEKQSKYSKFKRAVREAKLKFFLKSSCNENNQKSHNLHSFQQKHSIAIIAQIFRNQKSIQSLKSPSHEKQISNKWNLQLILLIIIPMICLLVILQEFIGLNQ